MFGRGVSEENERIVDMPGPIDFDPGTGAGKMRWRQLRELFEVCPSQPAEPAVQGQQAKVVWGDVRLLSAPVFVPCEEKASREWRQAGGDITNATRIEGVKARFGPELAPAHARHVEGEACAGGRDGLLERKWGLFCKVMERCGQINRWSGRSEQVCDFASAGGGEDCWGFLSLGACSRGDDCGFNHDGVVAGSRRAAVVDKQL